MPKGVIVALSVAVGVIACAFRTLEHFAALDFVSEMARSPTLRWVRKVSGLHSTVVVLIIVGCSAALFIIRSWRAHRAAASASQKLGTPPRRVRTIIEEREETYRTRTTRRVVDE